MTERKDSAPRGAVRDPVGPPLACAVVVCTHRRPAALDACLRAVAALDYPRFEVLVVDNDPDGTDSRAVALRHGARYVVAPLRGVSRARNRGAAACGDAVDVIAYLDDDALPEPGWLTGLAAEFADPAVMGVAGDVRPASLATEAEWLFERVTRTPGRAMRRAFDPTTTGWFRATAFGEIGIGANMAFRRMAFERWPGFDERMGYGAPIGGGEEHDAFFRLIQAGHRVVYTPRAVVLHPHPRTMAELRAKHLRTLAASSAYLTRVVVEEPAYRWVAIVETARWLVSGVMAAWCGTRRDRLRLAPPALVLAALASGPVRYLRTRHSRRPSESLSAARARPAWQP
jgi:GT2 family glycosyltransferase